MPGIAGVITGPGAAHRRDVAEAMTPRLRHGGSYLSGSVNVESVGLSVGWASHSAGQAWCGPVWSEEKDVCVLAVGDYWVEGAGSVSCEFGKALVRLYQREGIGFLAKLNGIFSGLVVDSRRKRVVVFNDRYGLGRIYLHRGQGAFYFASEAKALLQVLPHLRQFDFQSLGEYIGCGCVLQNRSLFADLSTLPAGAAWTIDATGVDEGRYVDSEGLEAQTVLSEEEYCGRLENLFRRILPRYFGSTGRVAMSLTGGLDSRLIMALAGNVRDSICYSHRGMYHECADARLAARVADECGAQHRTIEVGSEFIAQFPTLAAETVYISDGTMDVTGAAGLYANRVARELAPIRMTGNYGGEILRQVVMLAFRHATRGYLDQQFARQVAASKETLSAERRGRLMSFIAFKQLPWHHYARFALENSQWIVRSPYLDNDLVALAFRAPSGVRTNHGIAERLIAAGNPALAEFPTDRGPLGRHSLLGRIGEYYQELTFKAEYAYDYGMPQWLAKIDRIAKPLSLHRIFLGRHKYYHFRYWYANQLSSFVGDTLLASNALQRSYLDGRTVRRIVESHLNGSGNYTTEITALLTMELLQRELIENGGGDLA